MARARRSKILMTAAASTLGLAFADLAAVVGARVLGPSAGIVVDPRWEPEPTGGGEPTVRAR